MLLPLFDSTTMKSVYVFADFEGIQANRSTACLFTMSKSGEKSRKGIPRQRRARCNYHAWRARDSHVLSPSLSVSFVLLAF